jgi:hypothetical protein
MISSKIGVTRFSKHPVVCQEQGALDGKKFESEPI